MSKFITIEGGEGVGKSSAIHHIKDYLSMRNIDFIVTREPGGTPLAENIRDILLSDYIEEMDAKTELLLFFAGRIQHANTTIKPALAAGKTVICDRFMDASYAYQGGGRQLGADYVAQLESWLAMDLHPDATLLLDAPIEVGFARLEKDREKDRIEQEQRDFFERVANAYRDRAQQDSNRFLIIDASREIEQVHQQITQALDSVL